jgi:hypothetical protein
MIKELGKRLNDMTDWLVMQDRCLEEVADLGTPRWSTGQLQYWPQSPLKPITHIKSYYQHHRCPPKGVKRRRKKKDRERVELQKKDMGTTA